MAEEPKIAKVLFMLKAHFVREERAKSEVNFLGVFCEVQEALIYHGWTILAFQERVKDADIRDIYKEHEGREYYPGLINSVKQDSIALLVVKPTLDPEKEVQDLRAEILGPTDPDKARETAPTTLRAIYGKNCPENCFHASDSCASGAREVNIVFGCHL